jgi:hypothetical protein
MHDHQYNDLLQRSNGVPSFFALTNPLDERDAERVVEDELRCFKVDIVFDLVGRVLYRIPRNTRLYLQHGTYTSDRDAPAE